MSVLREKMKQDLILFGLAESTQQRYIEAVANLYKHYQKSPDKLTEDEIRNYLLALKKRISLLILTI